MSYRERERSPGPKKLLALDGGGIRGVLTLEILAAIEDQLRTQRRNDESFVLADYFDYIAGTSTGAVIAAGLALGMPVSEICEKYETLSRQIFKRSRLSRRLSHKYTGDPLTAQLKSTFGEETTFGDPSLRSLLLIVVRNATTDSPWPLSNNSSAMFNDLARDDCNLNFPLWQLVRASTAAPTFFPPEVITLGANRFVFVDGGVTMFNDPAFQLFLQATLRVYGLGWPTGVDQLLLTSVGTGYSAAANKNLNAREMNVFYNARSVPAALMFAAMNQQDTLCRVLGECRIGNEIDVEVGTLENEDGALQQKLFTYLRFNADLSRNGLDRRGLTSVDARGIGKMDSIERIDDLRLVGRTVADQDVKPDLFADFP